MAKPSRQARTEGSSEFDPADFFDTWIDGSKCLPYDNDLHASIISAFDLPKDDSYVYHAIASVTLSQVQTAISHGGNFGLHAWYRDEEAKPLSPPPEADILAYVSIFAPNVSSQKALTAFAANAKKGSIRSRVASHLQPRRLLPSDLSISKSKYHINPYYDYWKWSCSALEWAGPEEATVNVKTSHHVLPVFMHHFGCVVPSYEALKVIEHFAAADKASSRTKRKVLELGSGTGYWTLMLRRLGVDVVAVDSGQSSYRTTWIDDTIVADGEKYLRDNKSCADMILLLVYPIVGANFTSAVIDAYKGTTIIVAGTQNSNGYTAFMDRTIDDYMSAQKDKGFDKVIQISLPSFAGKDEALFVFQC